MENLMRADQMQQAAEAIVVLLKDSEILDIIRQCRVAASEKKHASLARLGHAGAVLMESTEKLDRHSIIVLKHIHLDSLTSPGYWRGLLADTTEESSRQAELVRLYSRVLFASSHLPALISLLSGVSDVPCTDASEGEQIMTIKLTDAGEKASDPDRLARAIDGIDMLYSACASLAKKPAMDLQLLGVSGQQDRDIAFLGDIEAIQAVKTIIESIPDAIADIDPDEELDIQYLVQSLPIFDDLKLLQKLGTYTPSDLQDIRDTMHQGVLLSLESGVVLLYAENEGRATQEPSEAGAERSANSAGSSTDPTSTRPVVKAVPSEPVMRSAPPAGKDAGSAVVPAASDDPAQGKDEYYDQYLQEREKLQSDAEIPDARDEDNSDKRDTAINNLLRGLKK